MYFKGIFFFVETTKIFLNCIKKKVPNAVGCWCSFTARNYSYVTLYSKPKVFFKYIYTFQAINNSLI